MYDEDQILNINFRTEWSCLCFVMDHPGLAVTWMSVNYKLWNDEKGLGYDFFFFQEHKFTFLTASLEQYSLAAKSIIIIIWRHESVTASFGPVFPYVG